MSSDILRLQTDGVGYWKIKFLQFLDLKEFDEPPAKRQRNELRKEFLLEEDHNFNPRSFRFKAKMCRYHPNCDKLAKDCFFYHGEEDRVYLGKGHDD